MPVILLHLSFLLTLRKSAFLLIHHFWQDHLEERMRTKKIELMFSKPSLKGFLWLGLFVLHSNSSGIDQMSESNVSEEVITKVGDVAKLSCRYKLSESLKSYKIYWQKPVNISYIAVPIAYVDGQEDLSSKIRYPHYQNRTKMDEQDLTLSIFPVRVSDEGIYDCVVIWNFDKQETYTVNLSVMADFSVPVIAGPTSICGLAQLTCSSHGGYPQPKMSGFVNNESVDWNYYSLPDNKTQLFNITGNLQINVTEDILVNCSVWYPGFQVVTSLKISSNCSSEPPPSYGPHGVIIAMTVILTFVALIVLVIVLRCHTCQHLRSSDRSCSPQPVATNEMTSQQSSTGASEAVTGKQVL